MCQYSRRQCITASSSPSRRFTTVSCSEKTAKPPHTWVISLGVLHIPTSSEPDGSTPQVATYPAPSCQGFSCIISPARPHRFKPVLPIITHHHVPSRLDPEKCTHCLFVVHICFIQCAMTWLIVTLEALVHFLSVSLLVSFSAACYMHARNIPSDSHCARSGLCRPLLAAGSGRS